MRIRSKSRWSSVQEFGGQHSGRDTGTASTGLLGRPEGMEWAVGPATRGGPGDYGIHPRPIEAQRAALTAITRRFAIPVGALSPSGCVRYPTAFRMAIP